MNLRYLATIAFSLLATGAPALAQNKPIGPRSLPGDNLMPFNMLDDQGRLTPMPKDFHPPAGVGLKPESTAPALSLDGSIELARDALEACTKAGFIVGVAVVDSVGDARALLTAKGSNGSHVFVAQRKAIVAVAFRLPSSKANELVTSGKEPLSQVTPAMFVMQGAVPITIKGQFLGAVGVSGAAAVGQDEKCAEQGLKKFLAAHR